MRINYLLLVFTLVLIGCKKSQEEPEEKQALIMAERSEMAMLMNEMYAFNESIKQQIIDGALSTSYPEKFDNIHSAVLTNPSARDLNFESFSKLFLEAQKELFESPQEELITRYNKAINACISCHNVKCVGPIPRIKKLLIK
jgi:cytochrome c553